MKKKKSLKTNKNPVKFSKKAKLAIIGSFVIIVTFLLLPNKLKKDPPSRLPVENVATQSATAAPSGDNLEDIIIVDHVYPGKSITLKSAYLFKSGFIIVERQGKTAPIGQTDLLVGEQKDLNISLDEEVSEGDELSIFVIDDNGDRELTQDGLDQVFLDQFGEPYVKTITVESSKMPEGIVMPKELQEEEK